MPFPSDVEQKSIIVNSPALGRDKIGRVPRADCEPPAYESSAHTSSPHDGFRSTSSVDDRGFLRSPPPLDDNKNLIVPGHGSATPDTQPAAGADSDASSIISLGDRIQASPDDSPLRPTTNKMNRPNNITTNQLPGQLPSHQQLQNMPPTPPPKDAYPLESPASVKSAGATTPFAFFNQSNDSSYFRSHSHSRAGSVYSLSRISFSNQISQLTSIKLPDPSALHGSISAISTSTKATRALIDASDQIQGWIQKASDVLEGLNAEDDVEWAAAAGRDGLHEVDQAINTFDSLINVYISSVEDLQTRNDASKIAPQDLQRVVSMVEGVTKNWKVVKASLKQIKEQVELAIEWQGIRDTVIGESEQEIDSLSRLVFELEEKRHSVVTSSEDSHVGVDLVELETIIEEPSGRVPKINRLAPIAALGSPSRVSTSSHENSELLGLYARMQPLRASLDFVPMRLASFRTHAGHVFPTACNILDQDQDLLEERYKKLEADADSLRRELGEDRWVLVFKNAGRQALRMIDSVARSIKKVDESLDADTKLRHAPSTVKKIESYEAKKLHYCPAIERVLSIVDKGVADRLTVNGEILRLQTDLRKRWQNLGHDMRNMDVLLEEYEGLRNQQLRDSLSSILSSEKSLASSAIITPGSSPASSVGVLSRKSSHHEPSKDEPSSPLLTGKPGPQSRASSGTRSTPAERRLSSLPIPIASGAAQKRHSNPLSQLGLLSVSTPKTPSSNRHLSASITPTSARSISFSSSKGEDKKPRWNTSTRVKHSDYDFKPLSAYEPSPYAKKPQGPFPRTIASRRTSSSLHSGSSTPGTLGSRASRPQLSSSPLSQRPTVTPKSLHARTPVSSSSARVSQLASSSKDAPASPSPAGSSHKTRQVSVSSAASNSSAVTQPRLRSPVPGESAAAITPLFRPSTPANRPTTAGSSGTDKQTPSYIPQPLTHRVPGHSSPEAIAAAVKALHESPKGAQH